MNFNKNPFASKKVDTREIELPKTFFIRDIENRVFQTIVLQCLSKIPGISLIEGNLFDSFLGRSGPEGIKGIHTEQDNDHCSVNIRVEINVCYGVSIPEKALEIQTAIAEEITNMTGLHVGTVHVVFKSVIPADKHKVHIDIPSSPLNEHPREELAQDPS